MTQRIAERGHALLGQTHGPAIVTTPSVTPWCTTGAVREVMPSPGVMLVALALITLRPDAVPFLARLAAYKG